MENTKFIIVGFGKLGSKELGYSSDLDLIFLYKNQNSFDEKNYSKLAKRICFWLRTRTISGSLYDVDLDLRPNGSSGLLVSSIDAYQNYISKDAMAWEHLALTRARAIAGDKLLIDEFNFLREVAGSSESVLLNQNNEIYNGEFDVLIDGSVVERTTGKPLREIDYKYYVHQISNSKKEIRLATLPIKNEQYKKQFTSLSEQELVTYANTTEDVVNFDNPNSNQTNQFTLGTDSSIQLDKSMIGGDFVINDAFEIMDLTNLNRDNDGFQITIGGKGANRHYGPGDEG